MATGTPTLTLNDSHYEFIDLPLSEQETIERRCEKTENDEAIEKAKQKIEAAKQEIEYEYQVASKKDRNKVLMSELIQGYQTLKIKVMVFPNDSNATMEYVADEDLHGFAVGEKIHERAMTMQERNQYNIFSRIK